MARGGFRPNAGRPHTDGTPANPRKVKTSIPGLVQPTMKAAEADIPDMQTRKRKRMMSPLTYMLKVMNDETAEPERRDRMAYQAAPLYHPKPTDPNAPKKLGKKEERQLIADEAAETGLYSVPSAPKLIRSN